MVDNSVPIFLGEETVWPTFWASFLKTVDKNEDLKDSEKLLLLENHLHPEERNLYICPGTPHDAYTKAKRGLVQDYGLLQSSAN